MPTTELQEHTKTRNEHMESKEQIESQIYASVDEIADPFANATIQPAPSLFIEKPSKVAKKLKVKKEKEDESKTVAVDALLSQDKELTAEKAAKYVDLILSDKKKEKPPTIDFVYISRTDENGVKLLENYKKTGDMIYMWNDQYWKHQPEKKIEADVTKWLETYYPADFSHKNKKSIMSMFASSVQEFASTHIKEIIIPTKTHWLQVDDVTGDVTAIKPNKNIPIRYQVAVDVPKAGPYKKALKFQQSKWNKFITSTLKDDNTRKLVQQYIGYTLTPTTRKSKMAWFLGSGSNGKSVLVKVTTALHANAVSVKPSEIDKYNAHLSGASLILATETEKKGFNQEFVKAAVSGDPVELRAIYGDKHSAVLTGKFIFCMNEIPNVTDFSNGLFRRVLLINFLETIDDKNADETLPEFIIENELEIFMNWALDGLVSLIKNKWQFTESDNANTAKELWKNTADKVRMFVSEHDYKHDPERKIPAMPKMTLFNKFNEWTAANNFAPMSSTSFWMRMNNIFPAMQKDANCKVKGERVCYIRIAPTILDDSNK